MNPLFQSQWARVVAQRPDLTAQTAPVSAGFARRFAGRHRLFEQWLAAVETLTLPAQLQSDYALPAPTAQTDTATDTVAVEAVLTQLMPWRKGPFFLCGVDLDCEWRSDFKYRRLQDTGLNVQEKTVLDVGAGNGYFLYRLLGDGARLALGIDPSWLYFAQFLLLQRFLRAEQAAFLPLTLEEAPLGGFDITLCMGVLYHRRDPLGFLAQLRDTLHDNGRLALETLVVEGGADTVYLPPGRYAGMHNVWFLPSAAALQRWLMRVGFVVEHCSEAVPTTDAEQRRTRWMRNHSLADFLSESARSDPEQPPPRRQILIARKVARQKC